MLILYSLGCGTVKTNNCNADGIVIFYVDNTVKLGVTFDNPQCSCILAAYSNPQKTFRRFI